MKYLLAALLAVLAATPVRADEISLITIHGYTPPVRLAEPVYTYTDKDDTIYWCTWDQVPEEYKQTIYMESPHKVFEPLSLEKK
jgi:hypothetical protein